MMSSIRNAVEQTGPSDSIKLPLMLLRKVGLHYEMVHSRVVLLGVLYSAILLSCLGLIFLQFFYAHGNVFSIAGNVEGFFAIVQHIGKIVCTVYHKDKMRVLVESIMIFTKDPKCTNKILQNFMKDFRIRHLQIQKYFVVVVLLCTTAMVIAPIFGAHLPTGVWTMSSHLFLYKILLVLESVILVPVAINMCAIDTFFLAFCVELILQIQLLEDNFESLQMKDMRFSNHLKKIISRHVHILRLFYKFRKFYSYVLAIEYFTIIPMICTEMYLICESDGINIVFKGLPRFILLMAQLGFYCIPAEHLTNQALQFAQSAFNSPWYSEMDHKTCQAINFVIHLSQKEILFTAGGLIGINARTLVSVVKLSWAACNVLRAIKR